MHVKKKLAAMVTGELCDSRQLCSPLSFSFTSSNKSVLHL